MLTRDAVDAPPDHLLHSAGKQARWQGFAPDGVQAARFFCQRAHRFDQKEGVALGFALQKLDQVFVGAGSCPASIRSAWRFLPPPADAATGRAPAASSSGRRGTFIIAETADDQQRQVSDEGRQPLENFQTFGGPLQILEQQDNRLVLAAKQVEDDAGQALRAVAAAEGRHVVKQGVDVRQNRR